MVASRISGECRSPHVPPSSSTEATVPAPASIDDGDGDSLTGSSGGDPSIRQVSPEQSTAAIAAFLLEHPYDICGEAAEVERMGRFIGLVCERCGEERVLEIVGERPDDLGH